MPCPVCRAKTRPAFAVNGCGILECSSCGHRCADLRPGPDHVARIYDDAYFRGGGAGYADYISEAALLRERGRWYARLLSRFAATGSLLSVGEAAGFVLEGFLEAGWQAQGLEPNARMAGLARERLGSRVEQGSMEAHRTRTQFDVVAMIQVVSHFYDLELALGAAAQATRSGGYWLIETWNRRSWIARAFGRRWHEYSPPSVLHWFSPEGLARLCARYGFAEIARGRPSKWLDLGHAASLLDDKLAPAPLGRAARALLSVLPRQIAIPYPGDDVFWMLLRKADDGRSAIP
jgi:SAM-dependent methyltransferase